MVVSEDVPSGANAILQHRSEIAARLGLPGGSVDVHVLGRALGEAWGALDSSSRKDFLDGLGGAAPRMSWAVRDLLKQAEQAVVEDPAVRASELFFQKSYPRPPALPLRKTAQAHPAKAKAVGPQPAQRYNGSSDEQLEGNAANDMASPRSLAKTFAQPHPLKTKSPTVSPQTRTSSNEAIQHAPPIAATANGRNHHPELAHGSDHLLQFHVGDSSSSQVPRQGGGRARKSGHDGPLGFPLEKVHPSAPNTSGSKGHNFGEPKTQGLEELLPPKPIASSSRESEPVSNANSKPRQSNFLRRSSPSKIPCPKKQTNASTGKGISKSVTGLRRPSLMERFGKPWCAQNDVHQENCSEIEVTSSQAQSDSSVVEDGLERVSFAKASNAGNSSDRLKKLPLAKASGAREDPGRKQGSREDRSDTKVLDKMPAQIRMHTRARAGDESQATETKVTSSHPSLGPVVEDSVEQNQVLERNVDIFEEMPLTYAGQNQHSGSSEYSSSRSRSDGSHYSSSSWSHSDSDTNRSSMYADHHGSAAPDVLENLATMLVVPRTQDEELHRYSDAEGEVDAVRSSLQSLQAVDFEEPFDVEQEPEEPAAARSNLFPDLNVHGHAVRHQPARESMAYYEEQHGGTWSNVEAHLDTLTQMHLGEWEPYEDRLYHNELSDGGYYHHQHPSHKKVHSLPFNAYNEPLKTMHPIDDPALMLPAGFPTLPDEPLPEDVPHERDLAQIPVLRQALEDQHSSVAKAFRAMDVDNRGVLSYDDFFSHLVRIRYLPVTAQGERISISLFKQLDVDRDDFLSPQDCLHSFLASQREKPPPETVWDRPGVGSPRFVSRVTGGDIAPEDALRVQHLRRFLSSRYGSLSEGVRCLKVLCVEELGASPSAPDDVILTDFVKALQLLGYCSIAEAEELFWLLNPKGWNALSIQYLEAVEHAEGHAPRGQEPNAQQLFSAVGVIDDELGSLPPRAPRPHKPGRIRGRPQFRAASKAGCWRPPSTKSQRTFDSKSPVLREELAATQIQAVARGRMARTEVQIVKEQSVEPDDLVSKEEAAIDIQAVATGRASSQENQDEAVKADDLINTEEAAIKIQAVARGRASRKENQAVKDEAVKVDDLINTEEAAVKIQAVARGRVVRKDVQARKDQVVKANNEKATAAEGASGQGTDVTKSSLTAPPPPPPPPPPTSPSAAETIKERAAEAVDEKAASAEPSAHSDSASSASGRSGAALFGLAAKATGFTFQLKEKRSKSDRRARLKERRANEYGGSSSDASHSAAPTPRLTIRNSDVE